MRKKFVFPRRLISIPLVILLTQSIFAQAPNISYTPFTNTLTAGVAVSFSPTNTGGAVPATTYGQITSIAGSTNDFAGYVNATGSAARFNFPMAIIGDASGNLYIADANNNAVRKITSAGVVTTFAGSAVGTAGYTDATGTAALFNAPDGLALDASGNLFVSDYSNNAIRKITSVGVVTTFYHTSAAFGPAGISFDGSGNLIIAAQDAAQIWKITSAGVVTVIAGGSYAGYVNGTGTSALFNNPSDVKIDASGNVFVADYQNNAIRKITPAGGVTTFAGSAVSGNTPGYANGVGTAAKFNNLTGVAIAGDGIIYVTDFENQNIRRVMPDGTVTLIAGSATQATGTADGTGTAAGFSGPDYIYIDGSGTGYITELTGYRVRKIVLTGYTLKGILPAGLTFSPTTGTISGTPTGTITAQTDTITAYNASGYSSTIITLSPPPQLMQVLPTQTRNYVLTYTPKVSGLTTASVVDSTSIDKTKVEAVIQYFDGLGRPLQTVQAGGSPLGNDIVQPFAYDSLGREVTKYLPYAPSTDGYGHYRADALTPGSGQNAFYATPPTGVGVNPFPYAETLPESSPLNRILEQGAPGDNWQLAGKAGTTSPGHTVKMAYIFNNNIAWSSDSVNSRQVALYTASVNSDQTRTLNRTGNTATYDTSQLYVTLTKDENWVSGRAGTMEEYKDKDDRVILKRVYNYTTNLQVLSTYYVYDDMGKLAFVLPPGASPDATSSISQTTLNNLCYQYRYDERGRLSQKKIPGKGWEYIVYNYIDEAVATQDSLQRAGSKWVISKYDALGRPVLSGVLSSSATRLSLQGTLTGITTNLYEAPVNSGNGYTGVAWPTATLASTLTLDYYDTYKNIPNLPPTYNLTSGVSVMTRGLPTVKKTAVLNTPTDQLWDVIYYDDLGRTTISYAQHYLGGTANVNNYDKTTTTYNFTNQPTTTTRKHWNTTNTTYPLVTIFNKYLYDPTGRKIKTWEQITNGNNSPDTMRLISQVDYNEIGQVLYKHLHSKDSLNFLQNIAYAYNERGWLLTSTSPLFAMQLYYNTGANKAYNGNIMYQYWGTAGNLGSNYGYSYDKLDRLLGNTASTSNYETGIAYDLMGNITTLKRYQVGINIDNLTYTYGAGTNQLTSISDATSNDAGLKHGTWNYTYDGNGNLLTDPSKGASGISIAYNMFNLPQSITGSKTITYAYDALGNKLRRVSPTTGNTDYINGIQYDGPSTPALTFIQTEEGRALVNGTTYNYEYNLGDNLGNSRVTFDSATGVARLEQQDNYYPFGLEISTGTVGSPKNEYLFNKKELQEELTEYDYGARFYDPLIARWNTIDPLAESNRRWSPYNYVKNNPIRLIDPDGMYAIDLMGNNSESGEQTIDDIAQQQADKTAKSQNEQGTNDSENSTTNGDDDSWLKKILAFFGISIKNQPQTAEDGAEFAAGKERLNNYSEQMDKMQQRVEDAFDWIPLLGAATQISKGTINKDYTTVAVGITTGVVDGFGGEVVTGITKHGVEQAIFRKVKPSSILDALRKPLRVGQIVIDELGRKSRRFIGRFAEVAINPETGKIISVNPTSTKKAAKLLKNLKP